MVLAVKVQGYKELRRVRNSRGEELDIAILTKMLVEKMYRKLKLVTV